MRDAIHTTLVNALEQFKGKTETFQYDSFLQSAVQGFETFLGRAASIDDISDEALDAFRHHLSASYASGTVKGYVSSVRRLRDFITKSKAAYQWHRRPRGSSGACPVCGLPPSYENPEHRGVEGSDGKIQTWQLRRFRTDGATIRQVGKGGKKICRKRAPSGPTPRVVKLIAQAATMQADGKSLQEVAKALEVKLPCISDWRVRFPALWEKAYSRAMEANLLLVREMAGTEAVLQNPAESMARARSAEKWCQQAGQQLLLPTTELTLCGFYETYYKPNCLAGNSARTFEKYAFVMRAWQLFTGDPPLASTTVQTLATFRDAVSKLPSRKGLSYLSPNTVRNYLRHLQAVLDKTGTPGRRNRDAAGLLQVVPWIKPPRELINAPRAVSLDDLGAVYVATSGMESPRVPGIKPPAWWRLLLVLTYNTGLRRRTLLSLRMDHINWHGCELVIPAKFFKNGRGQVVPLGPVVMQHLLANRTDRELVLPFPHDINSLYPMFYRLQESAGIPKSRRFGLHAIRRATATVLWGDSPQAAQLMLGHGNMSITQQRYVAGASILRVAADSMPQPASFLAPAGKDGAT